jgi:hypothetical protein
MWFLRSTKPEEDEDPPIVRVASNEFVSALVEVAEMYERQEKQEREIVKVYAERLCEKTHFNHGDVDRAVDEIRNAVLISIAKRRAASEIREMIQEFEYRGRRPSYMRVPHQES